ncbi:Endonuclease/Exonuclease/phosphatase family protein [Trichomonas vaginalis G3]|uniref:sphingomyelin phosphodiesterase n=1 Tax=Trichomonas vaginalis (strain ATCC PRA-98 / G3) TaxID=412133 RepID=A2EEI1_TRIV3|nr:sphingomyelinase DDB GG0288017 family [Trichomonas vaginalis G3]EAY08987.1 Endonuclease/Exonuclease/phosphatase family protein [Trichomonas vaginalis G3]KAI5508564.1 sphingomyelinase DDB GG0288017 family [Trichomonas vaginalis G3]|eukprot:XP_001321210.1 Endonuclease/Exonuclease/phosphatase family protein [Trichomonas vaginalis G3]
MDALVIIQNVLIGVFFLVVGGYIYLKIIGRLVHYNANTPVSKPDPNVNIDHVSFLTIDMQMHPKIFHPFHDQNNELRIHELLKHVKQYDVVAINEAHSSPFHSIKSFANSMKELGFNYSCGLPNVEMASIAVADGGVIIFSKLPILQHDYTIFQLCCGQDYFVSKGSVYARIQTTATQYIHVIATNLQSLTDNSIPESQAVRMNQIRETMRLISKNHTQDQFPVIVLGNLNIDSIKPITAGKLTRNEYERLLNSFKVDKCEFIDLLYDSQHDHVPTYGAGDKIITDKRDINKNLSTDYVIAFNPLEGPYYIGAHVTGVVKLEADNKKFNYISSHFGVESTVSFANRAPEA